MWSAKPVRDGATVSALGGGRESKQHFRLQVLEKAGVGGRFSVVKLVDDDHVELVRPQARGAGGRRGRRQLGASKRLHRSEHMAPVARDRAGDKELAKGSVSQHFPKRLHALLEDLLAMRNKEKCLDLLACAQALVVEASQHGLACAGCGHHQVARALV